MTETITRDRETFWRLDALERQMATSGMSFSWTPDHGLVLNDPREKRTEELIGEIRALKEVIVFWASRRWGFAHSDGPNRITYVQLVDPPRVKPAPKIDLGALDGDPQGALM